MIMRENTPRYCPKTTDKFEKSLREKKAIRMKISSMLVAKNAATATVTTKKFPYELPVGTEYVC